MKNRMVIYTATKVFRTAFKGAFAVGLGFSIGRNLGGFTNSILNDVVYDNILRFAAVKGSKQVKDLCDKHGIPYNTETKETNSSVLKNKIGFDCKQVKKEGFEETRCSLSFMFMKVGAIGMTNCEAADILKCMLNNFVFPRGCGKTLTLAMYHEAILKAISVLEEKKR